MIFHGTEACSTPLLIYMGMQLVQIPRNIHLERLTNLLTVQQLLSGNFFKSGYLSEASDRAANDTAANLENHEQICGSLWKPSKASLRNAAWYLLLFLAVY